MDALFSLNNLFTLLMLVLLQAVFGFVNLLYISIESKRVPEAKHASVRRWGIGIACGLRIVLLFAVVSAIQYFQEPFLELTSENFVTAAFNAHSVIVLLGGVFIMYTAMKEIFHMLSLHDLGEGEGEGSRSVLQAIGWIIVMNLVFSFDSILSALALTDSFPVMATAIVISGVMMIWLADHVSEFLKKNRMYEVLGLFILFIVGVMLLSEGAHIAHLHLFGHEVHPMAKITFYFVIVTLVLIDIVQGRYQRKLSRKQAAAQAPHTV